MGTPRPYLSLFSLGVVVATGHGCVLTMDVDFSKYEEREGEQDAGGDAIEMDAAEAGDTQPSETGVDGPDGCTPFLAINEIQTHGIVEPDDEFIELVNPSACELILDGFVLAYRSASSNEDHAVPWVPAPNTIVAPFSHYLIAGASYPGMADSFLPSGLSLSAEGAGLALRREGIVVDQVGWGTADNGMVDGMAAVAPGSAESIARHPDGADTNNNAVDFSAGPPTPRASN